MLTFNLLEHHTLPASCFPAIFHLQKFKCNINRYCCPANYSTSVLTQEGYIIISRPFNTVRNFPRTNNNTSNNTSPNQDKTSSLLASQALITMTSVSDTNFVQPSWPSMTARESSVNKTFFMLSSSHLRRFCTFHFANKGGLTGLMISPSFFRKRHRVVLDTVVSPRRLKNSPLVRPGVFTALNLIRNRELWQ